jgi:bile acid:Na+ symporter, BASS family
LINFDPESQLLLNALLAFIMFGVALDLSFKDIAAAFKRPVPISAGLLSQFILMPAMTFILVWLLEPEAGLALGLILVAACPGGNISNFISALAKADVALSVSLTAVSTLLCIFFTPLNFGFWAGMIPDALPLLRAVDLNIYDLFKTVFILLILPVMAGMAVNNRYAEFSATIRGPLRTFSMLIFLGFVVVAFLKNTEAFTHYLDQVFLLVMIHNMLALLLGFAVGRYFGLKPPQCRTLSIETGIQNSGLGLILCFNFFPEIGQMALVCAWWGIWHLVSGLSAGFIWSKIPYQS